MTAFCRRTGARTRRLQIGWSLRRVQNASAGLECRHVIVDSVNKALGEPAHAEESLTTGAARAEELADRRVYATGLYLGVAFSAAAFIAIVPIPPAPPGTLQGVLVCPRNGEIGRDGQHILRVNKMSLSAISTDSSDTAKGKVGN
jgi:hypothetical protein